jgi:hypothetical protein
MKNDNYINIQGWMVNELGLKGNKLNLYALIYGFSQDGVNEYKASLPYIGKALGVTPRQAIRLIEELVEKNLIIKTLGSCDNKSNTYKYNPGVVTFCHGGSDILSLGGSDILSPHYNNIYINNLNNNHEVEEIKNSSVAETYIEPIPPIAGAPLPFDAVFACFEETFKTRVLAKSPTRKGKIKARLKTFSIEQICQAIKNFASDPFYSGNNERKWKADLDYIIRSDEIIERGLNLKPAKKELPPLKPLT